MRKSRFTESQILAVLQAGEAGMPVAEIVRKHGISRNTYFIWKSKYAGATINEVRRLRELEQGAAEYAGAFERLFGTPHHADLAELCAATATPYQRISTLPDLRAALERPPDGIEVLEVPVDRVGRRELEARLRHATAAAVRGDRSES